MRGRGEGNEDDRSQQIDGGGRRNETEFYVFDLPVLFVAETGRLGTRVRRLFANADALSCFTASRGNTCFLAAGEGSEH